MQILSGSGLQSCKAAKAFSGDVQWLHRLDDGPFMGGSSWLVHAPTPSHFPANFREGGRGSRNAKYMA